MTEVVSMNRVDLVAEIKSLAIGIPDGALKALLFGGHDPSASASSDRPPVNWPNALDRSLLLRGLATTSVAQAKSFALDRSADHFVHQYKSDGSLLMLTVSGDSVRLLAPAMSSDVFAAFATLLQPTEAAPPLNVELEFSIDALTAFCAIVDRFRLLFAASLVQRQGLDAIWFGIPELEEQIKTGRETPDFRWLSALHPHLFPDQSYKPGVLAKGCEQLVVKKLLTKNVENRTPFYSPSPLLLNIAFHFINPLPTVIFEPMATGNRAGSKRTALINAHSLWLVECEQRKAFLCSIDGMSALGVLGEHIPVMISENESVEKQKMEAPAPAQKEQTLGLSAKKEVPSQMAKPVLKFCRHCGSKLVPNTEFCKSCGTPVKKQVSKSISYE